MDALMTRTEQVDRLIESNESLWEGIKERERWVDVLRRELGLSRAELVMLLRERLQDQRS